MSPATSDLADLITDLANGDITPGHALALLRKRGRTPDRDALADAVAAHHLRDVFALRQGDPYAFVGMVPSALGPDPWDEAVRRCDEVLDGALTVLARPGEVAA
jgi:hypothetical protein